MGGKSNVKLGFEGLVPDGWYGPMSYYDGYGGFNFEDMELITKKWITEHGLWGDGFGSALRGDAETFTTAYAAPFGLYSWIVPAAKGQTFDLKSGIFAMETANRANFGFFSAYGADGQLKGTLALHLSNVATTIDFAKYGNEFQNLSALKVEGYNSELYPPLLIMDNLKIHWNSRGHDATHCTPTMHSAFHVHSPHVTPIPLPQAMADHENTTTHSDSGIFRYAHHGEIYSLDVALGHADPGGGLTAQFALPHYGYFGT